MQYDCVSSAPVEVTRPPVTSISHAELAQHTGKGGQAMVIAVVVALCKLHNEGSASGHVFEIE
jgi:hypothetical protein